MEEPSLSNNCCTCAYMESQCYYNREYIITSEPVLLIKIFIYFYIKLKINEVLASLLYLGKLVFFLCFFFTLVVGFHCKIEHLELI